MAELSFQASNAIVYLSYGAMLVSGLVIAWAVQKKQHKVQDFLSSNGSQTGWKLALNFFASGTYLKRIETTN